MTAENILIVTIKKNQKFSQRTLNKFLFICFESCESYFKSNFICKSYGIE